MRSAPPRPHRWTRERYDACITAGIFRPGDRVQLVDGELIEMSPQNSPHSTAIRAANETLIRFFRTGHDVRAQLPLTLGNESEPEPDIAVVRGHWRDFAKQHPTTAVLVVEISDTTLEFDRSRKREIFAQCGIPEYWIVNLNDRQVEVQCEPRGRV